MTNEEILNKRWKVTDNLLKNSIKDFNKVGIKIIDEVIEFISSLGITYKDLNKTISNSDNRKLNQKIQEWKKEDVLAGYLAYLITSKSRYTYAELIELVIYAIYAKNEKNIDELSNVIFKKVAVDIYNQTLKETNYKPKKEFSLTWEFIQSLLWVSGYNKSYKDYLKLLTMTNYQEMAKLITSYIQQNRNVKEEDLQILLKKQINRVISINNNKYSGVLSDTCRELANEVYIAPFKEEKTLQVRFIAEIDNKTTKMCKGIDNMLFYVNDWNRFYRYSELDKKDVLYTVKGLERGVNLPPINNHFHWCRSTITYQLEETITNNIRDNIKVANNYDKEQFERYKKYFGDEIPDNVEEFVRMKYNNPDEWNYLKSNYNDKKLQHQIKTEYNLKVNIQKNNVHILETPENIREMKKRPDISILTINNEKTQEIVYKYAGNGKIQRKDGVFINKELIVLNKNIGYVIDVNNKKVYTNIAYIHYSKTGTHLVPTLKGSGKDVERIL